MPLTDSLSLGPAPAEEVPVRPGAPDYAALALAECRRHVEAIRRVCGGEPAGARLRVARRPRDCGGHDYDVVLRFDAGDQATVAYARKVEACAPATWDEAGLAPIVPEGGGKVYRVERRENGVAVTVEHEGRSYPLPPRNDLRDHSPAGFNYGYGGSGPAQLALALCCDALGDDGLALRAYQAVKASLVARLDGDGPVVAQADVLESARAALLRHSF